jgi:dolichyl-phosphate-mannose-protein mannosyltransferase
VRAGDERRLSSGPWARLDTTAGLGLLFAIGLAVRLVLAWKTAGFSYDVSLFRLWSERLVADGPGKLYGPGQFDPASAHFVDYAPGYLYVLYALGKVTHWIGYGAPSPFMLKLPGIAADLGVAVLSMLLAERFAPPGARRRCPPRVIGWGQVDSFLALLVIAACAALAFRRGFSGDVLAVVVLALAVVTKPQVLLVLPAFAVVIAWRRFKAPDSAVGLRRASAQLSTLAVLGLAIVVVMFAPFGVAPLDIPSFYADASAVYPVTSVRAFNVWGMFDFMRPDSGSAAPSLLGVSANHIGLALFVLAAVVLAACALRALARFGDPALVATYATVAFTCAGFATLTRGHERYLYLAAAALAPLATRRLFGVVLVVVSAAVLLNVHFVYERFNRHPTAGDGVSALVFGRGVDTAQQKVLSGVVAGICLVVAGLGWIRATGRVAREHP